MVAIILTTNPTAIGMAVRFTTSKGDTPAIPDVTTMTAVIVVTSGIAGVSPFEVVKRTAIPMAVGFVVNMVATIALFY